MMVVPDAPIIPSNKNDGDKAAVKKQTNRKATKRKALFSCINKPFRRCGCPLGTRANL